MSDALKETMRRFAEVDDVEMGSWSVDGEHVSRVGGTPWAPGPWDAEPDRVDWAYRQVRCLALRVPRSGHWCGYTDWHGPLPKGLPSHEDSPMASALHAACGEVTVGFCGLEGFDCSHIDDMVPGRPRDGGVYRDIFCVRARCHAMVDAMLSPAIRAAESASLRAEADRLLSLAAALEEGLK